MVSCVLYLVDQRCNSLAEGIEDCQYHGRHRSAWSGSQIATRLHEFIDGGCPLWNPAAPSQPATHKAVERVYGLTIHEWAASYQAMDSERFGFTNRFV